MAEERRKRLGLVRESNPLTLVIAEAVNVDEADNDGITRSSRFLDSWDVRVRFPMIQHHVGESPTSAPKFQKEK